MLPPREKSPLSEKFSEEDRTHDAASRSRRSLCATCPGPALSFEPDMNPSFNQGTGSCPVLSSDPSFNQGTGLWPVL